MNTTTVAGKCYVDSNCDGCQGCLTFTCPYGAISFDTTTNTATIDESKCIGYASCSSLNGGTTTLCEDACPGPVTANIVSALAIKRA